MIAGLIAFTFTAISFAAPPGCEVLAHSARPCAESLPADQGEAAVSGES